MQRFIQIGSKSEAQSYWANIPVHVEATNDMQQTTS